MSHQQLVESVCDKAQQLVDQTQDKSLNIYLQSIKQLFQNIVVKSQVWSKMKYMIDYIWMFPCD
jgi:nesprin-1